MNVVRKTLHRCTIKLEIDPGRRGTDTKTEWVGLFKDKPDKQELVATFEHLLANTESTEFDTFCTRVLEMFAVWDGFPLQNISVAGVRIGSVVATTERDYYEVLTDG